VPEAHLDELNGLDAQVESAVESDDEPGFESALAALLDAVRSGGTRLPDDALQASDLVLPPSDATIEEVRALLGDEGLIPG
jgi:uncharacterized protein (UPF0210 family)